MHSERGPSQLTLFHHPHKSSNNKFPSKKTTDLNINSQGQRLVSHSVQQKNILLDFPTHAVQPTAEKQLVWSTAPSTSPSPNCCAPLPSSGSVNHDAPGPHSARKGVVRSQGLSASQFLLRHGEENHREDTHFLTHPQASPGYGTSVTMAQMV